MTKRPLLHTFLNLILKSVNLLDESLPSNKKKINFVL
jgi:hypothetical protein